MTESRSVALPLGYTPIGRRGQIRTAEPDERDLQSAAFSHLLPPANIKFSYSDIHNSLK